jgi:7,8-dihydroneopterin aldolase/epimerase/oxygenase
MSNLIKVTGIWGFGYHGVFEHEAKNGQDFFVDLEISIDLTKSSKSDDLKDTIDYGSLADLVVEEITGERVQLIERLAGRIADRIKGQFTEIEKIAVTVHKPKAPVSAQVADISVTITR